MCTASSMLSSRATGLLLLLLVRMLLADTSAGTSSNAGGSSERVFQQSYDARQHKSKLLSLWPPPPRQTKNPLLAKQKHPHHPQLMALRRHPLITLSTLCSERLIIQAEDNRPQVTSMMRNAEL